MFWGLNMSMIIAFGAAAIGIGGCMAIDVAPGYINFWGRFGGTIAAEVTGLAVPVFAAMFAAMNLFCAVDVWHEQKYLEPYVDTDNHGGSIVTSKHNDKVAPAPA